MLSVNLLVFSHSDTSHNSSLNSPDHNSWRLIPHHTPHDSPDDMSSHLIPHHTSWHLIPHHTPHHTSNITTHLMIHLITRHRNSYLTTPHGASYLTTPHDSKVIIMSSKYETLIQIGYQGAARFKFSTFTKFLSLIANFLSCIRT